jgi:hypothetical protein
MRELKEGKGEHNGEIINVPRNSLNIAYDEMLQGQAKWSTYLGRIASHSLVSSV